MDINLNECENSELDSDISEYGRRYGLSGGVAEAVKQESKYKNVKPCYINGINKEVVKQLKQYAKGSLCPNGNLVEVMCCEGGCVGGNATIKTVKSAALAITEFSKNSHTDKKQKD